MPTPSLLIVPARFKTGKLYSQIPTSGAGDFTVTRNTTATRFGPDGLIASVASGIPRLDYYTSGGVTGCPALLVEPSAQNLALQSRDLSQAVWVKTNVTATKNAVGADGSVSGATTLTATAASGMVLQSIVNISQSRVFSAYVRRVSGTGAIQMTTNGGTNWTTVSISSIYTQVACAAQTVLNGSVGFRMAVSGDVIEVDYTQGEVGPIATSAIPTTTAAVTRNADVISVSGAVSGSIGQTEGTIYWEGAIYRYDRVFFALSSGTSTSQAVRLQTTGAGLLQGIVITAGGVQGNSATTGAVTLGQFYKVAFAYKENDFVLCVNGVLQTPDTLGTLPTNLNSVYFCNSNGTEITDQRCRAAAIYTTRLSNAELQSLTQL